MLRPIAVLMTLVATMSIAKLPAATVTAQRTPQGVTIQVDGKPFCDYLTRSGNKPILWPVIGPTGKPLTRSYPMQTVKGETIDHVHQRSFWFTHGNVNGIDFWAETDGPKGTILHRQFLEVANGSPAIVATRNDWMGPKGDKVCEDQRRLAFGADEKARWIDFDITIKATAGPVTFGDTKEGSFGIRVAESLNVDAKKGGQIVNSEGLVDAAAWGKRAAWVDYHGPVGGETVGIAIMNHPDSFRFPTYWHVRTYGLFAANPFGLKDFTADASADGVYTMAAGKQITFRYRVYLHRGDQKQGHVAEAFAEYAKPSH